MPDKPKTVGDWLKCIGLPEFLAMTPSGHMAYTIGPELWTDGNGNAMTKDQYIARWGVDPEIGWGAIKEYRRKAGKKDKMVVL